MTTNSPSKTAYMMTVGAIWSQTQKCKSMKATLAVIRISMLFGIQDPTSLLSNNQFHFQCNVVEVIAEVYTKFIH
jgi:hypothetical protein